MPTTTTTTIGTEVFWFLTVYDTDIPDANDSSMETQNPEKPEWQTEQISVPAMEGQCYVKEKYPLLDLCYTELPCSRVVALCFCYPFGDCPTLGSCIKISDSNRCSGVLFHFEYDKCEAGCSEWHSWLPCEDSCG